MSMCCEHGGRAHTHTRCTRLAREPTRGTLSPAVSLGPGGPRLDFPASSSIGTRPFYANAENVLHLAVHLQQLLARGEPHSCVCHCSAGVGRTGTLIALLRVLQRLPALQSEAQLDGFVRTTIERMRERRLWMVKTDVEYALLYAATLLWLRRSRDQVRGALTARAAAQAPTRPSSPLPARATPPRRASGV